MPYDATITFGWAIPCSSNVSVYPFLYFVTLPYKTLSRYFSLENGDGDVIVLNHARTFDNVSH